MNKRTRETIQSWLNKESERNPEFTFDKKLSMMKYFENLSIKGDEQGNTVLQLASAKWYCNHTVILPEDQDKVTTAVKTALYNKVDPLSFDRPMKIIERFGEYEERVGMKPEDVSTFKLLREKDGIQIFKVGRTDKKAYENCRNYCLSHFGKEDNLPWCLTREYKWWKHYNTYPKLIALQNGRPVAFCANDNSDIVWWDRLDKPKENITVTRRIPGDKLHRVGTIEINSETLEVLGNWTDIHTGDRKNGEVREWNALEDEIPRCIKQYENKKVVSAVIPDGVTMIGDGAFYECSSLQKIHIPDSVTLIGDGAFYDCSNIQEIHIPDSVITIGDRSFTYCSSLQKLHIPDGVTTIGEHAFSNCNSLKEIHISNGVTTIGTGTFYKCRSLREIHIPDGVTTISNVAFYECSSLKEVHIPDSVTTIGDGAFYECRSLKEVHIPDSVTTIGNGAFYECRSLREIHIPDGVTTIGSVVFYRCSSLKEVHIPDSVTTIGEEAFSYCSFLQEIRIPDSVTTIDKEAFSGCPRSLQTKVQTFKKQHGLP